MPSDAGPAHQRESLIAILEGLLGDDREVLVDALLPQLGWRHVAAGETLFRQGEPGDDLYFVVSGRLRAIVAGRGGEAVTVGEIMRGQTIGEMALLTGEARSASIVAIRDSVLAMLSHAAYDRIAHEHPQLAMSLTRLIIGRLRAANQAATGVARPVNICLLPITDSIDAAAIAYALARELSRGNRVLVLGRDAVCMRHGTDIADSDLSAAQYRQLTQWLDEIESSHEFLVFVADPRPCEWTRRCIRDSDQIVLLADADDTPMPHAVEVCLDDCDPTVAARRTLVLLHPPQRRMPSRTQDWLARRAVDGHIHIRPQVEADIGRLARLLGNKAVGLVLSGGGARGFAHLGVLKALEQFGAHIDTVGGASIGAVMGAYCAFELPAAEMIRQAREAFARGPTGDYNLVPVMSLIGGRRLRRIIDDAVLTATGADIGIEDTWKNLYGVASNYTRAAEVVVTRGNLAKWLRTSVSIPGVLPLVSHDGELLGDGGSFNNFPTDLMAARGAGYVIGSDLLQKEFDILDIEELPSNRQLLFDRLRPRAARRYRVPGLMATLVNAMMLVSQSRQREARRRADLCFTPALAGVGMLDWGRFDEIVELGYRHASEVLERLPDVEAARLRGADIAVADGPVDWTEAFGDEDGDQPGPIGV